MASQSPEKATIPATSKSSSPPATPSDTNTTTEDPSTHTLRRLWQRYAQTVIHADRVAAKQKDSNSKEVSDAIIGVLRNNVDLRRTVTHVEGKLTGQAQETQALEGCMKSQASVGRKRKRDDAIQNGQPTRATSGASSTPSN